MATGARSRRRLIFLAVLALLVAFGAWFVDRQLEPQRLTATVLGRLGKALQLDFTFSGTPDYAFRPEPRLQVPNLVVTDPATGKVVLRAKQLDVSLPWATVRGGPVVITRLDLDQPQLDVAGLQRWLAARPAAPFTLPTFVDGLAVRDGVVAGDGWWLRGLFLDMPRLEQDAPLDLAYRFRFEREATVLPVRGNAHLAHAALASDFTLAGGAALARASGPVAASYAVGGHFDDTGAGFALRADTLRLQGKPPVPGLVGRADVQLAQATTLTFAGMLSDWPAGWPALPAPLDAAHGPFPIAFSYRGKGDFSDPLGVGLVLGEARLAAATRVPELMAWLQAPPASPLPPVTGHVTVPLLEVGGTKLSGVRIEMGDDVAPEPATVVPRAR